MNIKQLYALFSDFWKLIKGTVDASERDLDRQCYEFHKSHTNDDYELVRDLINAWVNYYDRQKGK